MAKETDPNTGRDIPDTATTYERAKPEKESPSGSLLPPVVPDAQEQDKLARNASPGSAKNAVDRSGR